MPITILMPALSPTMEQGTLAKWLKAEGDAVQSGDIIAEIETDKATMEFEAVDEGVLGKILVSEGTENVPVNSPIALMLEADETQDALKDYTPETPGAVKNTPEAQPENVPESQPISIASNKPDVTVSGNHEPAENRKNRIIASPLAKRLAKTKGLDLELIKGSGPKGRIIARDIKTIEAPQKVSKETPLMSADTEAAFETVKIDGMRKTIAARLVLSKQTVPHFYLSVDCMLDKLMILRRDINDASPESDGAYKVSVNDFIIKALALSLIKVPEANAIWDHDKIIRYQRADIGVAVAVEGGLFTPVVRSADTRSLIDISNDVKALAAQARQRKLMPEAYQGGVSSVSNLGMYGVKDFSAIINPPQSSILAVGAGEKRPIIGNNNDIIVKTVMTVTLSCDHRVIDGALGAELLSAFKTYIQNPVTMLI